MLKNSPMKNLPSHRDQAINLQHKSIDWFLPNMSFHRKGLLNSPGYKNRILCKTHKQDLNKSIHFTLTRLLSWKNV